MAAPNYAFLPTPDTLQFQAWAAVAVEQLAAYGLPTPPEEPDWQQWAANFVNGTVPGTQVPDPNGFSDWRTWAAALIGTLA